MCASSLLAVCGHYTRPMRRVDDLYHTPHVDATGTWWYAVRSRGVRDRHDGHDRPAQGLHLRPGRQGRPLPGGDAGLPEPVAPAGVDAALGQLCEWGNLEGELADLASAPDPDEGKTDRTLLGLRARFEELTSQAQAL